MIHGNSAGIQAGGLFLFGGLAGQAGELDMAWNSTSRFCVNARTFLFKLNRWSVSNWARWLG
jgi:hypothetical protein